VILIKKTVSRKTKAGGERLGRPPPLSLRSLPGRLPTTTG
jgi:hypothetical protein